MPKNAHCACPGRRRDYFLSVYQRVVLIGAE